MANDLQVQANSLKGLLEKSKKEIEAALPKHVTPERMLRVAMTEARKNPKLLDCEPASFLGAIIQASQLGLEPGGALGHCWLIPYGKEVNFQVGYRGMLDLAYRSEKVSHAVARAVYDSDEFEFELGLNESIVHRPRFAPNRKLIAVYCVVFLKNGGRLFDVMSKEEIEEVRAMSKAGNSGPWRDHYEEMAKKSVVRRLFKYTPVSIEMQKAVGMDELADAGENQENGSIIETTGRAVPEAKSSQFSAMLSETPQEAADPRMVK